MKIIKKETKILNADKFKYRLIFLFKALGVISFFQLIILFFVSNNFQFTSNLLLRSKMYIGSLSQKKHKYYFNTLI